VPGPPRFRTSFPDPGDKYLLRFSSVLLLAVLRGVYLNQPV